MHLWQAELRVAAEMGARQTMTDARERLLADRYLLKRRLGVSGSWREGDGDHRTEPSVSSEAWEALDTTLGMKVFIKLLSADTPSEIVRAYHDLWQRLTRVQHPGVPATLYHGVDGGQSFVVTKWVNALTLEDAERRLRPGRLGAEQLIENITVRALQALAALHETGIVHGDISPSNILVSESLDKVWLIDPAPTLPAGQLMTTFAWAAPELRAGFPPTPRSDLYALGKVLARCAGRNGVLAPLIVDRMVEGDVQLRPAGAQQALGQFLVSKFPFLFPGVGAAAGVVAGAGFVAGFRPTTGRAALEWLREESKSNRTEEPPFREDDAARRRAAEHSEEAVGRSRKPRSLARSLGPTGAGTVGNIRSLWGSATKKLDSLAKKIRPTKAKQASATPIFSEGDTDYLQPARKPEQDEPRDWSDRTSIANVPIISRNFPEPIDADFVVMGPTIVARGQSFPLELWMGRSSDAGQLRERAQERGIFSDRGNLSKVTLPSHTILTLSMTLPGFTIANSIEHITWDGSIRNAAFILHSNEGLAVGQHWGTLKLLIDAKPLGMISFCVEIGQEAYVQLDNKATLSEPMQRFRTAFASYASPDRAEVFKRVQAIRASRVDVFADIADLRGGERWEDVLMREIDTRDVFYLFWSQQAAASPWVEREWRRAIDTRGLGFICPIPLEDPRFAKPPAELSELHFNDWCLAIIQSEQAMASDGGYEGKS